MREEDETTVQVNDTGAEDEEIDWDINNDEFKDYFDKTYEPKVIITSTDNPHAVRTILFDGLPILMIGLTRDLDI